MANTEVIFGRNPANEVIRAGRRKVHKLILAEGVVERGTLARLIESARKDSIPIERIPRRDLDREYDHHQGVKAIVGSYPYSTVAEILDHAKDLGELPFVLLLDEIQDPQNFGALLRTAEAVGVHGVVIPHRRGVGVTQVVISSSAGASEHLLIVRSNLVQAMKEFKKVGLWIVGLEKCDEAQEFDRVELTGAIGLVVGSEAKGMRRLVRESCDYLLRLPMRGRIASLNAAVAGSIVLYSIWKARGYDVA